MTAWRWLSVVVFSAIAALPTQGSHVEAASRRLAEVTMVVAIGQVNLTVNSSDVASFKSDAKVSSALSSALSASVTGVHANNVTVTAVEDCSSRCGDTNLVVRYQIQSSTRIVSLILADVAAIRASALGSKLKKQFADSGFLYSEPFAVAAIPDGSINSTRSEGSADDNVNAFEMPLSGVHRIVNVRSRMFATMEAMSVEDGGRLIQCSEHSASARWQFDFLEHNIYTITNVLSKKLVTVQMNSKANGVLLHQWGNSPTHASSQWALYEVETGVYVLANVNSNKLMSVTMNSIESAVGLNQWGNEVDNKASQWELVLDPEAPANVTVGTYAGELCKDAHPDQFVGGAASLRAPMAYYLAAFALLAFGFHS